MPLTKIRKRLFTAAISLFILILCGCATPELSRENSFFSPQTPGTLSVGITASSPYFVCKEAKTGSFSGLEIDFSHKLAGLLGLKLKLVELSLEEQIPALEHRKVDIIMSAIPITEMRQLRVAFTEPYLTIGQLALTVPGKAGNYPSAQTILATTGRVGVEKGSTGDIFVQRYLPAAEQFYFPTVDAALSALRNNKIDLFIHDAPVIWSCTDNTRETAFALLDFPLTTEQLAWAVHKEETALLAAANKALREWKDDGSLQELLAKWLPPAGRK